MNTDIRESRRPVITSDVLIVGSGPVGATFARVLSDRRPGTRITMVELGPQLTTPPGENVKNLDGPAREKAQRRSQGRAAGTSAGGTGTPIQIDGTVTARAGTHLVDPDAARERPSDGMPAAAMSTCVGGMGAHWSCVTPRPWGSERVAFIPEAEWEEAISAAERLLCTTTKPYPDSALGTAVRRRISDLLDPELPAARKVCDIPIAAKIDGPDAVTWTGVDTILGALAQLDEAAEHEFELRAETLCRELITDGNRVTGAVAVHLPSGAETDIQARVVIVAADSLRTPQLLWNSEIRPPALGRYLNEHPLIMGVLALDPELDLPDGVHEVAGDPFVSALRIPFCGDQRPFGIQVTYMPTCPLPLPDGAYANAPGFAVLGAGGRKFPREEDRVEFSDTQQDAFGMPQMTIHYELTAREREEMARARNELMRVANVLGAFVPGGEPQLLPEGSSLHFQGTIRMGAHEGDPSVCDSHSRVWGFENLFVGGNGVIPTAALVNPTLTSVAFAVRACDEVLALLTP